MRKWSRNWTVGKNSIIIREDYEESIAKPVRVAKNCIPMDKWTDEWWILVCEISSIQWLWEPLPRTSTFYSAYQIQEQQHGFPTGKPSSHPKRDPLFLSSVAPLLHRRHRRRLRRNSTNPRRSPVSTWVSLSFPKDGYPSIISNYSLS